MTGITGLVDELQPPIRLVGYTYSLKKCTRSGKILLTDPWGMIQDQCDLTNKMIEVFQIWSSLLFLTNVYAYDLLLADSGYFLATDAS